MEIKLFLETNAYLERVKEQVTVFAEPSKDEQLVLVVHSAVVKPGLEVKVAAKLD